MFQIGLQTRRSGSARPLSSMTTSWPRSTGELSRYQRMASAPWVAKTSSGSGKLRSRLESLRPSSPSTMPCAMQVWNGGRSNSAVASTCKV